MSRKLRCSCKSCTTENESVWMFSCGICCGIVHIFKIIMLASIKPIFVELIANLAFMMPFISGTSRILNWMFEKVDERLYPANYLIPTAMIIGSSAGIAALLTKKQWLICISIVCHLLYIGLEIDSLSTINYMRYPELKEAIGAYASFLAVLNMYLLIKQVRLLFQLKDKIA